MPHSAFELAVLELKAISSEKIQKEKSDWDRALKEAATWLGRASSLCQNSIDMSTRLEIRIAMLQDEVKLKQAQIS